MLVVLYLLASHHFTDTVRGGDIDIFSRRRTGIFPDVTNVIIGWVPPVALSAHKAVFNLY